MEMKNVVHTIWLGQTEGLGEILVFTNLCNLL